MFLVGLVDVRLGGIGLLLLLAATGYNQLVEAITRYAIGFALAAAVL